MPDHITKPTDPPAWKYYQIWMELREKIQNEELKTKYQLKRIKEENEEALEFIYDVYEKFPPNEDEYLEAFEIKEIEEVLKKVEFSKIERKTCV